MKILDRKTFISLYKALVRTHLDYASLVWTPYKIKHTNARKCAKMYMPTTLFEGYVLGRKIKGIKTANSIISKTER